MFARWSLCFQSSSDSRRALVDDLGQVEESRKLGTNFNLTCSDLLEGTLCSVRRTQGSTSVIHGFVGKNFQALATTQPYTALFFASHCCTLFPTNSTLHFLTIVAFPTCPHLLTLFLLLECSTLATPFWFLLAFLQASDHMPFP